jgi:hypothetical protein
MLVFGALYMTCSVHQLSEKNYLMSCKKSSVKYSRTAGALRDTLSISLRVSMTSFKLFHASVSYCNLAFTADNSLEESGMVVTEEFTENLSAIISNNNCIFFISGYNWSISLYWNW